MNHRIAGIGILLSMAWGAAGQTAADLSGKWSGISNGPIYMILKQDGDKLSGSGGPSEREQPLSFQNGKVEGDRLTFQIGSMQFDLRVAGGEIKGEMQNGAESVPVFLKRVTVHAGAPQTFEVASVKRAPPPPADGFRSSMKLDPGRLTCSNVTLKKLIVNAYNVKDYQVSGPEWLNVELYDIAATVPPGAGGDQVLAMVQGLLAERFKLAFHREAREMPVFGLVVGKAGARLHDAGFGRSSTSASPGHLTAEKTTMAKLADFLARQLDRPVVDMTGLKGFYDFTLEWDPEENSASGSDDGRPAPPLLTAVQQQLGLSLQARKAPVEILVIDHADRVPIEN